jgi:hypothetical protein
MITQKEKGSLVKPAAFTYTPPSFWINPPEPIFALSLVGRFECFSTIYSEKCLKNKQHFSLKKW